MNGYNLLRDWYNFKFANPSKVKAIHSDMYCYLIDRWNRLGQKKEFGLPTSVTMEALGIGSYNTYKRTIDDLIQFGFIEVISESKNQHQSKVIALSNNDKATDKALDEAHIKATDKSPDTINKQKNKETIVNNNPPNPPKGGTDEIEKFCSWFNNQLFIHTGNVGKFKTMTKTDISNLKRLKQGYSIDEWEHAFKMMIQSEWVQESKMATVAHFLRNDNFSKYVNQADESQVKKWRQPY